MSDDYEVGYGKPPKQTQFQKGQSGNPNGRPKGTKNLKTDLQEELREHILIREGERAIKVSKQRAVVKSLVARTLKGDGRAASTLLNMMIRILDIDDGSDTVDQPLSRDEREALQALEARLLRRARATKTETAAGDEEETK